MRRKQSSLCSDEDLVADDGLDHAAEQSNSGSFGGCDGPGHAAESSELTGASFRDLMEGCPEESLTYGTREFKKSSTGKMRGNEVDVVQNLINFCEFFCYR